MYVLSFVFCSMFCWFNVYNMFIFFVIKFDFFYLMGILYRYFRFIKKFNCVRLKMGLLLLYVILVSVLFELLIENLVSIKMGK